MCELPDESAARYDRRCVGAPEHEELWVPAEELPELNARLVGLIRVAAMFYGERFSGEMHEERGFPIEVVNAARGR